MAALAPFLPPAQAGDLPGATQEAVAALCGYREWLRGELRALRVEVDIALALGELTLDQAAERLRRLVPMDEETAWEEAVFFSGNPGQGLSYQTGKLQIQDLLAAAAGQAGFGLRAFHDRLWQEGNVPVSLQRWELLADSSHLTAAGRLAPGSDPR